LCKIVFSIRSRNNRRRSVSNFLEVIMNTNQLNNIKIASPCSADWNQMIGNERKRFCGSCKLNVYNLSDMSKIEAESFLMASEGRVCVKFFKRADGTVLTKDCPVGWAKVKQKVSRTATAAFGLIAGLFGGLFAFTSMKQEEPRLMGNIAVSNSNVTTMGTPLTNPIHVMGDISAPIRDENPDLVDGEISNIDEIRENLRETNGEWVVGKKATVVKKSR
jgi:hypothetical protein